MRQLNLPDGVLFTFTDAAPPPASWSYSFPEVMAGERPDLAKAWFPDGRFHTRFAVFALEQRGRIVLIDAGLGPQPSPYFDGLAGRLDGELRSAGIEPSAVAHVIFTHFHLDHVGWASREDGTPFFENATYHAPRIELSHWRNAGAQAALPHHVQAFERSLAPLISAGRIVAGAAGRPLVELEGMTLAYRAAPGPTPGHHAVEIVGRQNVLIAGDAWHSPAQISAPNWCHRADRDRAQALVSRIALAEWSRDNGAVAAAGHFPENVSFGRIRRAGESRLTFDPIESLAP